MTRWQTFSNTSVVATGAVANDLEVIDGKGRLPLVGAVTVLAQVGSVHVIQALAILDHVVMTTHAVADNAAVIKGGW